MSAPPPAEVDWDIHRVASSSFYSSSLYEIETLWTICDVWDANRVIDVKLDLERKAAAKRRPRKRKD